MWKLHATHVYTCSGHLPLPCNSVSAYSLRAAYLHHATLSSTVCDPLTAMHNAAVLAHLVECRLHDLHCDEVVATTVQVTLIWALDAYRV
jgi:hypothetical protein